MYTPVTREVDARYPHRPRQQAASCGRLLIWLARGILTVFSTDHFLAVLQEIMTETGIPERTSSEACGRFPEVNSEVNSEVNNSVNQS